jgi:hypothetical protein
MGEEDNGVRYFCYQTISNQIEMIIQIVLMGLSLLLVGDAFRKYYRMRGSHNNHVSFVYRLLFFWWISTYQLIQHTSSLTRTVLLFFLFTIAMHRISGMTKWAIWPNTISLLIGLTPLPFSGLCYICPTSGIDGIM